MNNLKRASVWIPLIVAIAFIVGFLAGDIVNRQSGPTPTQKFQTILNLIRKDYVDEVDLDSVLERHFRQCWQISIHTRRISLLPNCRPSTTTSTARFAESASSS